jgi:hypothetical protein
VEAMMWRLRPLDLALIGTVLIIVAFWGIALAQLAF